MPKPCGWVAPDSAELVVMAPVPGKVNQASASRDVPMANPDLFAGAGTFPVADSMNHSPSLPFFG